jgi:pilus assembly protein CpaB
MDRTKLVLLVVALLVAVGPAFAARSLFAGASSPGAAARAEPKGPKVLVAQRALPTGTIITADSTSFQSWPEELVKDAYYLDGSADMTKLVGTVVRFPITAGQPVTKGALVAPGDRGFLAAALGPGMRAVTISVKADTSVGGFVFPGDRVDLVLTQTVKGDGMPLKAAETFLRNLRVLATDQRVENETMDGKTVVKIFRTVTLEVTPRIAEKIAVAQEIGEINLSLRSLADSQAELDRIVANSNLKLPKGASRKEEETLLAMATSQPIDTSTTYVTGADVSRFQRRSNPNSQNQSAQASMGVSGRTVRVIRGDKITPVAVRR